MKILVTGCAGFIGSHLVDRLMNEKYKVIGIDNFNDYYDPKTKKDNLKLALQSKSFKLYKVDILDNQTLIEVFAKEKPKIVIHLAARAGVRPSIINPRLYSQVNILGTVNLLKLSNDYKIKRFIFGSSSSVYGESKHQPFEEIDPCINIISPYGASKRAAEFWVESFYDSYKLKSVILRFFTVYGPRGRPDMAPALFTKAIIKDDPITQYGDGTSSRDYTYVDDIVDGIIKTINKKFEFEIINLGNNRPVNLTEFITILEKTISKKAKIKKIQKQVGDVNKTWANIQKANRLLGWKPKTELKVGLEKYIKWIANINHL